MGYDKQVYAEANAIMQDRRNNALMNADREKAAFFKKYPQAQKLEQELSTTLTSVTRVMLSGSINLKQALNELKENNLATQQKLNAIYRSAGITEKDLEPKFNCTKCEDRGNIDGKICDCYNQLVKEIACNNLNKLSPFKLSTFDTFSLDYYSSTSATNGEISDRDRMKKYFDYCKNYAETFSTNAKNILMRGNTGLGKTHLSLAIARQVIEKGFGVIYCSTPEILAKLEKEHFGKTTTDENSEDTLKECDLLILDDLGSEFQTSFTKNTIYNLINSRLIYQKATIISTNLDFDELESIYSKRLISRLYSEYTIMNFVGTDIRRTKRLEKYK